MVVRANDYSLPVLSLTFETFRFIDTKILPFRPQIPSSGISHHSSIQTASSSYRANQRTILHPRTLFELFHRGHLAFYQLGQNSESAYMCRTCEEGMQTL